MSGFLQFQPPKCLILVVATDHRLHNTASYIVFNTICYDFPARLKEEGRVFYCIQFEGVALSQGCNADPRKLKREKVQNPTSAKIATLENFPLYGNTKLRGPLPAQANQQKAEPLTLNVHAGAYR